MHPSALLALLLLSSGATALAAEPAAAPAAEVRHFGAAFTTEQVLPVATLLADPASYVDRTLRIEGRVADVCQKAGCWMVLTDGERSVRILMKDHSFAVAKDAAGSIAQVEGVLTAKTVDPEEAAHFESESANREAIPEADAEPGGLIYELIASAVALSPSG